jgi:hypothetical protein
LHFRVKVIDFKKLVKVGFLWFELFRKVFEKRYILNRKWDALSELDVLNNFLIFQIFIN